MDYIWRMRKEFMIIKNGGRKINFMRFKRFHP
jgi:hypothetical protein